MLGYEDLDLPESRFDRMEKMAREMYKIVQAVAATYVTEKDRNAALVIVGYVEDE